MANRSPTFPPTCEAVRAIERETVPGPQSRRSSSNGSPGSRRRAGTSHGRRVSAGAAASADRDADACPGLGACRCGRRSACTSNTTALASKAELRWFAKAGRFALADDSARPWGEFVAELRDVWAAAGRWCPPMPVLARHRVRYLMPEDGLPGLPHTTATAGPSTGAPTRLSTTGTPCPRDVSPSTSRTACGPSGGATTPRPAASLNTAGSAWFASAPASSATRGGSPPNLTIRFDGRGRHGLPVGRRCSEDVVRRQSRAASSTGSTTRRIVR